MMISSLNPGARDLVFFPPGFGLLGFRIFWSCYLLEQGVTFEETAVSVLVLCHLFCQLGGMMPIRVQGRVKR
ncbi:hypothetical protein NC651_037359 [Populus alba x Populus x berolinensis]|nr:hypothetical protein NC651_037359 [Populus alba x Populus x berolinensis]